MSNILKLKRSKVPGRSPQINDLVLGELAVNTYDGRLFFKKDKDGIESVVAVSNRYTDLIGIPEEFKFSIAGDDSTLRTINANESIKFTGTGGIGVTTDIEGNVVIALDSSATNPFVFTTSGNFRTLSGYKESAVTYNVRTAEFFNNNLRLELATFTPLLTATTTPGLNLNWDVACTAFRALVDNPADFTLQWINDVAAITATTGSVSVLENFVAGAKSNLPGGGIDWNQTFTTNASSYIRPSVTSGLGGGSCSLVISFTFFNGTSSANYTSATASATVNWATPSNSISIADLAGNTFLQTYASTTYNVGYTGMNSLANVTHSIVATGGTVTNSSGSGTFNFTNAIHKDNTAAARNLSLTTTFTRPAAVTGSSYTAQANTNDPSISASFSYPSFWLFTASTSIPPTREVIIIGSGFEPAVTVLGNQAITFSQLVNVTGNVPKVFWFGVRNAIAQPTSFKTGTGLSLLVDVDYTMTTVSLNPDSVPAEYISESYKLYGIILQPGDTYVNIS